MSDKITVCIGSIGYPTFKQCRRRVKEIAYNDSRIKEIVVVRDKHPISEWLNEMRKNTKTPWLLQVDEDMYLYDNCIDELLSLAKAKMEAGIKINNASGMLYDLFLGTNIGSIKLWNTEIFGLLEFRNVLGSDRDFAKRAAELGYHNVATSSVLGDHDSAPTPEIAYFKYKEYVGKIKEFQGLDGAKSFIKTLEKIKIRRNDPVGNLAYIGGLAGLNAQVENVTKDYINILNSKEYLHIKKKYKLG
jgi:hypothetical protein